MRISVSLRIFLGFIAVLVAFGGVSVFHIVRTQQVQQELERLNKVYLRLGDVYRGLDTRVTQLSLLHRNLGDLIKTAGGSRSNAHLVKYLPLARRYRAKWLAELKLGADHGLNINAVPGNDREFLGQVLEAVTALEDLFKREDALYAAALAERRASPPPVNPATGRERLSPARQRLQRGMGRTGLRLRRLSGRLRRTLTRNLSTHVRLTARRLEKTGSQTLIISVAMTIFAVLVAVVMMFVAHWTLRPLRVLREGARVIGRGEYGHRVEARRRDEIGDLALEFNAMAGALEEREQKIIETERLAARSEHLATLGRAAAQITHEVRNPLSAVQLNAEMAEEELATLGDEPAAMEARQLLGFIQREVDRLTEITEAYLQFSRQPRPRLELDELEGLLRDVLQFVGGELEAVGVTAELALDDAPLPQVAFDESQLRQALLNLIRNAKEAMEADGGLLTLSAKALPGGGIELVVADRGTGLEAELADQVFEPFVSTKEKGTGLGLAITSQIIEEHGGRIRAEPRSTGPGTRFVITLPAPDLAPTKPPQSA